MHRRVVRCKRYSKNPIKLFMLYKDTIREKQLLKLTAQRGVCVSIFLPTTPLTQAA